MKFIIFNLLVILNFIYPCLGQSRDNSSKDFKDGLLSFPKIVFLIPESLEKRWISVEFENSQCKKVQYKDAVLTLRIPNSGHLCTSMKLSIGIPDEEFYVVDKKGRKTAIKFQERIFASQIKVTNLNNKDRIFFKFFFGSENQYKFFNQQRILFFPPQK